MEMEEKKEKGRVPRRGGRDRTAFKVTESFYICDRAALNERLAAMAQNEGVRLSFLGDSSRLKTDPSPAEPESVVPSDSPSVSVNVTRSPAIPPSVLGLNPSPSFIARSLLTDEMRSR